MRKTVPMLLLLAGCGYVESAKQKVGLGPNPQQMRSEAEAKAAREKAEREKKLEQLREADALTAQWADRLASQPDHYQGLTEPDPWGNMVQYEYTQEGLEEVITASSPGPDEQPGSGDDLRHSRRRTNLWGAHRGYGHLPVFVIAWVSCGFLAVLATSTKGRHKQKKSPVISALAIVIASPVIVICAAFMIVIMIIGSIFDGDGDGLDINLDIFDFDINLFGD